MCCFFALSSHHHQGNVIDERADSKCTGFGNSHIAFCINAYFKERVWEPNSLCQPFAVERGLYSFTFPGCGCCLHSRHHPKDAWSRQWPPAWASETGVVEVSETPCQSRSQSFRAEQDSQALQSFHTVFSQVYTKAPLVHANLAVRGGGRGYCHTGKYLCSVKAVM